MIASPWFVNRGEAIALTLLGFFLSVTYWYWINGAGTSPRWALLSVIPLLILICLKPVKLNSVDLIGLVFIGWSALSLLWTSNIYDGLNYLILLIIFAQSFVLGSRIKSLKPVFIGLALGITVSSLLLLFTSTKAGLFVNQNLLAEAALLILIGLCIYELWWFIPGVLPSLIIPNSRGVFIAGSFVFCSYLWKRSRLGSAILALGLVGLAGYLYYIGYRYSSIEERFVIWNATVNGLNLLGNGIGSFATDYAFLTEAHDTTLARPRYVHNDFLQIVFELGIVGMVCSILFSWKIINTNENERYIFLAFIIIGLFSFPLYLPVTAFIAALVSGYVVNRRGNILS